MSHTEFKNFGRLSEPKTAERGAAGVNLLHLCQKREIVRMIKLRRKLIVKIQN
jgi:hypothetical protein